METMQAAGSCCHRSNHRREEVKRTRRHLSSLRGEGVRKGAAQNEGKGGKIGNSESKVLHPGLLRPYATSRRETDTPDTSDRDEKTGPKESVLRADRTPGPVVRKHEGRGMLQD